MDGEGGRRGESGGAEGHRRHGMGNERERERERERESLVLLLLLRGLLVLVGGVLLRSRRVISGKTGAAVGARRACTWYWPCWGWRAAPCACRGGCCCCCCRSCCWISICSSCFSCSETDAAGACEPSVPHERPPPPPCVQLHSQASIASHAPCLRAWPRGGHDGRVQVRRRAAPRDWRVHATSLGWCCRCCGYGGGGARPASALLARPPNSHAIAKPSRKYYLTHRCQGNPRTQGSKLASCR